MSLHCQDGITLQTKGRFPPTPGKNLQPPGGTRINVEHEKIEATLTAQDLERVWQLTMMRLPPRSEAHREVIYGAILDVLEIKKALSGEFLNPYYDNAVVSDRDSMAFLPRADGGMDLRVPVGPG